MSNAHFHLKMSSLPIICSFYWNKFRFESWANHNIRCGLMRKRYVLAFHSLTFRGIVSGASSFNQAQLFKIKWSSFEIGKLLAMFTNVGAIWRKRGKKRNIIWVKRNSRWIDPFKWNSKTVNKFLQKNEPKQTICIDYWQTESLLKIGEWVK